MSKMGQLVFDLQEAVEMAETTYDLERISKELKVPMDWVRQAYLHRGEDYLEPDLSDYDEWSSMNE